MKNVRLNLFICATVVLLTGCAAGPARDDTAIVEQRAVERWNLLIAHQAEKAYDYLSPGYRTTQPREQYAALQNNTPVRRQAVHFMDKECDQDTCVVRLELDAKVNMHGTLGKDVATIGVVREHWVKLGRAWYFLPDNPARPVTKGSTQQ